MCAIIMSKKTNGGIFLDLNLFENLKKDIETNVTVKNFINELTNFLNNINLSKTQDNITNNEDLLEKEQKIQEYRKEGHLYLVTEDRNNEIYLWDFTEKSKNEFKETILSNDLLKVAKEGAMLQYKNGTYELYSPYGFDMVSKEKK